MLGDISAVDNIYIITVGGLQNDKRRRIRETERCIPGCF